MNIRLSSFASLVYVSVGTLVCLLLLSSCVSSTDQARDCLPIRYALYEAAIDTVLNDSVVTTYILDEQGADEYYIRPEDGVLHGLVDWRDDLPEILYGIECIRGDPQCKAMKKSVRDDEVERLDRNAMVFDPCLNMLNQDTTGVLAMYFYNYNDTLLMAQAQVNMKYYRKLERETGEIYGSWPPLYMTFLFLHYEGVIQKVYRIGPVHVM